MAYGTGDHVEVEVETDFCRFFGGEGRGVVFAAQEAEFFAAPPADADGVVGGVGCELLGSAGWQRLARSRAFLM